MVAVDEEELQPVEIIKCPSADVASEWFAGKYLVMNKTTEKEERYSLHGISPFFL